MRRNTLPVLLVSCFIALAHGAKILVNYTPQTKSHAMGINRIAGEMAARGHELLLVAPESDVGPFRLSGAPVLSYRIVPPAIDQGEEFRLSSKQSMANIIPKLEDLMSRACTGMMNNSTLLEQIKEFDADLMLAELFFACSSLVASRMDLQWVNYFAAAPLEPYLTSLWPGSPRRAFTPNPLSYYPQISMSTSTQFMTFAQRVENVWHYVHDAAQDLMYQKPPVAKLYKKFHFEMNSPVERRRLVLSIAPVDWAVEWLRPMSPNFKMVGPILSEPGKPLPADLEAFMQGAGEQGVLLIALGTVTETSKEQMLLMAEALAKLPARVLWRLSPQEIPDQAAIDALRLGSNTKVSTWVPQNDVLAHPNAKAFLSHCGVNSMYEAVYHGKPVIALPFFGDQPNNADKMVSKGMAVKVSPSQIGSPGFLQALLKVLTEDSYSQAARALSRKLRAHKRTPVQQAGDWLEHVIETKGDPYLKTPEDELSFIVRHNLDVYGMLAASAYLLLLLGRRLMMLLVAKAGEVLGMAQSAEANGRRPSVTKVHVKSI